MGHAAVYLIAAALAQAARPAQTPPAAPQDLAKRWLVLGQTHDTREAAEAQAAEIRRRHYPDVRVIDNNHYSNMIPGRFAVVFWAFADKQEAKRRALGIWVLGHRSWARWSGAWVEKPTPASLRQRRERLLARGAGRATTGARPERPPGSPAP